MSYCRWSSDSWKCDLYCYADVSGGYTTHVAGRRRVGNIPDDKWDDFALGKITADEFIKLHSAQMKAVEACDFEEITLPHSGETFNDPDLESFKKRLLYLRGLGYSFPDHVLSTIDEEMAEEAATERDHGS